MMKRTWVLIPCLLTTSAFAALMASSAAALPEVGRCVAQPGTGKYAESNCFKKAASAAEKQFEFKKGAVDKAFTDESTSTSTLGQTARGESVTCTRQTSTGEYSEVNGAIKGEKNVVWTFEGCQAPFLGGVACESRGQAPGIIVFNKMAGKLGYISGKGTTSPTVGQELHPEAKGHPVTEFECGGEPAVVGEFGGKGGDCVIAPDAPVNVMASSYGVTYSGSDGEQHPQYFQTTPTKICNWEVNYPLGEERSTASFSASIFNGEPLEIKG